LRFCDGIREGCKAASWNRPTTVLADRWFDGNLFLVYLAHTRALPQYAGVTYINDFSDARRLAHLLALGTLPTGYINPREVRGLRHLLRRRLPLVRQQSLHHLSLQSLIAQHRGKRLSANAI
jgi:transposase